MEARSPNNKNIPSELTFSLDIDTPPHGSLGWSVSGTLGNMKAKAPQSERGLVVGAQPLEFGLPGLPFNAAALLNPRGVKFEVA